MTVDVSATRRDIAICARRCQPEQHRLVLVDAAQQDPTSECCGERGGDLGPSVRRECQVDAERPPFACDPGEQVDRFAVIDTFVHLLESAHAVDDEKSSWWLVAGAIGRGGEAVGQISAHFAQQAEYPLGVGHRHHVADTSPSPQGVQAPARVDAVDDHRM